MSLPAISVENLSKAYLIGLKDEVHDTLTSALWSWTRAPLTNLRRLRRLNTFGKQLQRNCSAGDGAPVNGNGHASAAAQEEDADILWALRDVSFDVQPGEVVGIIGRNGAGKSTLLKILSRITDPTNGRAVIRGRVSSLLEVGTGFHPELTGRENVYMNGTILGMRKREIDRKFDEIASFSGVEKFLDTPVKRYSSGMKVRLAFAVAAHLEPEILIIDEVLAVGDFEFQAKCLGKMNEVATDGRTVLFVSHNLAAIADLCHSACLLSDGHLVSRGVVSDIIGRYITTDAATGTVDLQNWTHGRSGSGPMRLCRAEMLDAMGVQSNTFATKDPICFRVTIHSERPRSAILALAVRDKHSQLVIHQCNIDDDVELELDVGMNTVDINWPASILNSGSYFVTIWLGDGTNLQHDRVENCLTFSVDNSSVRSIRSRGAVLAPARWFARTVTK